MRKFISLTFLCLTAFLQINATVYTSKTNGKWTNSSTWLYGKSVGEVVEVDDTVVINSLVSLNVKVQINGTVIIRNTGSLVGYSDLIITAGGELRNRGNTIVSNIINEGNLINNLILETMYSIKNNGIFYNNESVMIGGDLINDGGVLKGTGGNFYVNNNMVNSNNGYFKESINISYGKELINEGYIDTLRVSINNEILNKEIQLIASLEDEKVELSFTNHTPKIITDISIERSINGKKFKVIKRLEGGDDEEINELFFSDKVLLVHSELQYKVTVSTLSGEKIVLPMLSVANNSDYFGMEPVAYLR